MAFSQPIVGGNVLLRQEIRSENYVPGVSGWRITRDGDAEFNDITARGNITASSLIIQSEADGSIMRSRQNDTGTLGLEFEDPNDPNFDLPGAIETTHVTIPDDRYTMLLRTPNFTGRAPAAITMVSESLDGDPDASITFSGDIVMNDVRINQRLSVSSLADIEMENMRPEASRFSSNGGRTLTSIVYTEVNALGDVAEVTVRRPTSGSLNIKALMQCGISAGQGLVSYEIRDTSAGGTLRVAASDQNALIANSAVPGNNTYEFDIDEFNIAGTSSNLYVRLMYRTTTGGTFTLQRMNLFVKANF